MLAFLYTQNRVGGKIPSTLKIIEPELIGIKDQNIKISLVFETNTHIEIQAKLDYPIPLCPL